MAIFRPTHRRPIPQLLVLRISLRRARNMAMVTINWTTEDRPVTPTIPALDTWRVTVAAGGVDVAMAVLSSLDPRSASLEVPAGASYVASVALVSADGTVLGPAASSSTFDVPMVMAVPVAVSVAV